MPGVAGSSDDSETLKSARTPRLLIQVASGGDGAVLVAVTVLCKFFARYRQSRFLRILTFKPEFASFVRAGAESVLKRTEEKLGTELNRPPSLTDTQLPGRETPDGRGWHPARVGMHGGDARPPMGRQGRS